MAVELLEKSDIFDFYGCEYVYSSHSLSKEDRPMVEFRIREIHEKYLHSVRERIRAEMSYLGIETGEGASLKGMLKVLEEHTFREIDNQTSAMIGGQGFNMMKTIIEANKMAGRDVSDVDGMFGTTKSKKHKPKNSIDTESLLKDPKWHVISVAFTALEDAQTIREIIKAIDNLNDLQHNSFHLLIDLQTGRMLENKSKGGMKNNHNEAVDIVKEVLDIKHGSSTPQKFADKMTPEVRKLVKAYR